MFNDTLFDPDDPRWISAPRHNEAASRLLKQSFAHIAAGPQRPLAYARAYDLAAQCASVRRSAHQDMLVNLALGLALLGMSDYPEAIDALALALDGAHATADLAVAIELYEVLSSALRCRGRWAEAADVDEEGLQALESAGGAAFLRDPITMRLLFGRAVSLMNTGNYAGAAPQLAIARELAREATDTITLAAIDQTMANIHTARGDMHAALPLMLAARDAYLALGDAATPSERRMQGRLHAIAAGVLLDVAEVHARRGQDVRDLIYVEMAGDFARQALDHAAATGEPGARHLGTIALARHQRISGRASSAIDLLTPLLAEAERTSDFALPIQVHTAIGQDYAARGDHEHARRHYQQAYHGASTHHADFLGAYAQRELLRGMPD